MTFADRRLRITIVSARRWIRACDALFSGPHIRWRMRGDSVWTNARNMPSVSAEASAHKFIVWLVSKSDHHFSMKSNGEKVASERSRSGSDDEAGLSWKWLAEDNPCQRFLPLAPSEQTPSTEGLAFEASSCSIRQCEECARGKCTNRNDDLLLDAKKELHQRSLSTNKKATRFAYEAAVSFWLYADGLFGFAKLSKRILVESQ